MGRPRVEIGIGRKMVGKITTAKDLSNYGRSKQWLKKCKVSPYLMPYTNQYMFMTECWIEKTASL
jgi:hypothetical protein